LLTPALDKLAATGLLGENALWKQRSNQLFLFCWKNKLEAVRKTEKLSGYEWWLIQDYQEGSNGILDAHWTPKHDAAGMAVIKTLNQPLVLLAAELGENLPLLAGQNGSRMVKAYTSG
jgi:hypothetical protein